MLKKAVFPGKYVQGEDLFVYAAVSGPGKSRLPMLEALQAVLPSFRRKSVIVRGEPGIDTNVWQDEWVNVRGWAEDRYELLKPATSSSRARGSRP